MFSNKYSLTICVHLQRSRKLEDLKQATVLWASQFTQEDHQHRNNSNNGMKTLKQISNNMLKQCTNNKYIIYL